MVIFHSYVSLPEGNPNKGKKNRWLQIDPEYPVESTPNPLVK